MIRSLKTLLLSISLFALVAQTAPAPLNTQEYVTVLTEVRNYPDSSTASTITPGKVANTTRNPLGSSISSSYSTTTLTSTITITSTIPFSTSTLSPLPDSGSSNQKSQPYQGSPAPPQSWTANSSPPSDSAPKTVLSDTYTSPRPSQNPLPSYGVSSSSSGTRIQAPLKNVSSSDSFVDGIFDCDQVPDVENVIRVATTSGGWASIQNPNKKDYGADSSCTDGNYCSYACKAGFLKTQWPSEQPSSGVSVGGLICKNGKLYKTRPDIPTLCIPGTGTLTADNRLSQEVAICRTDYPGSEDVNVPTSVGGESTADIAVVDSDSYYKTFKGLPTSSHYYVNKAGVSAQEGCAWNSAGSGKGNWAPIILGAGTTGAGTANSQNWFSLAYNPENKTPVDAGYKVRFVAAHGGTLSAKCEYANGVFNGDPSLTGCTVAAPNGALLEFY